MLGFGLGGAFHAPAESAADAERVVPLVGNIGPLAESATTPSVIHIVSGLAFHNGGQVFVTAECGLNHGLQHGRLTCQLSDGAEKFGDEEHLFFLHAVLVSCGSPGCWACVEGTQRHQDGYHSCHVVVHCLKTFAKTG